MGNSTYLARKGARYHFRRRLASAYKCSRPISISLGTADPVEARRLVRRLAAIWDEIDGMLIERITRGTLTLAEGEKLFRKALEDELAHATRHRTAPIGTGSPYITSRCFGVQGIRLGFAGFSLIGMV